MPIIEKRRGAKSVKMIYGSGKTPTRTVSTSRREQASFVLDDDEIVTLGRWAQQIEQHYGCPMDIEWAKDGETGNLFIVQARPETVRSREDTGAIKQYAIRDKGKTLVEGLAVGGSIVAAEVCLIEDVKDLDKFVFLSRATQIRTGCPS